MGANYLDVILEERVWQIIKNIRSSHPRAARKVLARDHRVYYWLHPRRCIKEHFPSRCIKNMMFAQRHVTVGLRKPVTRIAVKEQFLEI